MFGNGLLSFSLLVLLSVIIHLVDLKTYDPKPDPRALVVSTSSRFRATVLTSKLVRLEFILNKHDYGQFDDRPTRVVINRLLPVPKFQSVVNDTHTFIDTGSIRILWREDNEEMDIIKLLSAEIVSENHTIVQWKPFEADLCNLKGTYTQGSLDCYKSPEDCFTCSSHDPLSNCATLSHGLLSRNVWSVWDDTLSPRMDERNSSWPWWHLPEDSCEIDIYLFAYGQSYEEQLGDAAKIMGGPSLPPLSPFGVWWSREWKYSASSFETEVLKGFADHELPLHHVVLDYCWHTTNPEKKKLCFESGGCTWNTSLFPDPVGFVRNIQSGNNPTGKPLRIGLNLHPQLGIDQCQKHYHEFAKAVGRSLEADLGLPLFCDFGRQKWAEEAFKILLGPKELDFWWTDEAADNLLCGGPPGLEQLWSNYVFTSHQEIFQNKRGLVLSRYGGLGNHRYPIGFSGDAFQTWTTLEYEIKTTPTASNVMFGYWSHDIGAFHGYKNSSDDDPTNLEGSEMYLRWIQFGSVAPIFRTHANGGKRRIWLFPYFKEMKQALLFRNAMVPFYYTLGRHSYDTGVSMIRPMYYQWSKNEESYDPSFSGQYMIGDNVLVAPVSQFSDKNGTVETTQWLPPGARWNTWDCSQPPISGPTIVKTISTRSSFPLFSKVGTIVPMRTMKSSHVPFADPLIWVIFTDEGSSQSSGKGVLYEDDGESLDYKDSSGAVTHISYSDSSSSLLVTLDARIGKFEGIPTHRNLTIQIRKFGLTMPSKVVLDEKVVIPYSISDIPGWYVTTKRTADHWTQPDGSLVIRIGSRSIRIESKVQVFF